MERGRVLLLALLALLLTSSAVRADTIQASLDNPPDHTGIAGIGTINGWAFATELRSNLVSGHPESSGPPARYFFLPPIDEPHGGDDVSQMTEAASSAPSFLGAHGERMYAAPRRLLAQTVPGLRRA